LNWSIVQRPSHDVPTPEGRTSAVADVLHVLQVADEPRRLDRLAREAGDRDAHDVSRAMAVLVAQGLASRTPRGYTATSLGRRSASTDPSRFSRGMVPSRQSGAHSGA
jgi:hypothetical protein